MFLLALIGIAFLAFTSAKIGREKNDLFADVFLLLAVFCPFQMSSYLWGSWASLGAVPFAFFFVLFFVCLEIKKIHLKNEDVLFLLFTALFFASSIAYNVKVGADFICNYLIPFVMYLLLRCRGLTSRAAKKIDSIFFVCVLVVAIWSVVEFFFGYNPYRSFFEMTKFTSLASLNFNLFRNCFGPLGHPLFLASFALMCFFRTNDYILVKKIIYYVSLFLIIVCSASRAAIVILLLSLFVKLLTKQKTKTAKKIIILVSFLALILFLYNFGVFDNFLIKNSQDTGESSGTRLGLFKYVFSFVSIIPFFGYGFDYDFMGGVFKSIGVQTVVEIPWFFLFLEFGWIGMLLLSLYSYHVLKKMKCLENRYLLFATFLMISSYNSIMSPTIVPLFFCFLLWNNKQLNILRGSNDKKSV